MSDRMEPALADILAMLAFDCAAPPGADESARLSPARGARKNAEYQSELYNGFRTSQINDGSGGAAAGPKKAKEAKDARKIAKDKELALSGSAVSFDSRSAAQEAAESQAQAVLKANYPAAGPFQPAAPELPRPAHIMQNPAVSRSALMCSPPNSPKSRFGASAGAKMKPADYASEIDASGRRCAYVCGGAGKVSCRLQRCGALQGVAGTGCLLDQQKQLESDESERLKSLEAPSQSASQAYLQYYAQQAYRGYQSCQSCQNQQFVYPEPVSNSPRDAYHAYAAYPAVQSQPAQTSQLSHPACSPQTPASPSPARAHSRGRKKTGSRRRSVRGDNGRACFARENEAGSAANNGAANGAECAVNTDTYPGAQVFADQHQNLELSQPAENKLDGKVNAECGNGAEKLANGSYMRQKCCSAQREPTLAPSSNGGSTSVYSNARATEHARLAPYHASVAFQYNSYATNCCYTAAQCRPAAFRDGAFTANANNASSNDNAETRLLDAPLVLPDAQMLRASELEAQRKFCDFVSYRAFPGGCGPANQVCSRAFPALFNAFDVSSAKIPFVTCGACGAPLWCSNAASFADCGNTNRQGDSSAAKTPICTSYAASANYGAPTTRPSVVCTVCNPYVCKVVRRREAALPEPVCKPAPATRQQPAARGGFENDYQNALYYAYYEGACEANQSSMQEQRQRQKHERNAALDASQKAFQQNYLTRNCCEAANGVQTAKNSPERPQKTQSQPPKHQKPTQHTALQDLTEIATIAAMAAMDGLPATSAAQQASAQPDHNQNDKPSQDATKNAAQPQYLAAQPVKPQTYKAWSPSMKKRLMNAIAKHGPNIAQIQKLCFQNLTVRQVKNQYQYMKRSGLLDM